jgi:hypothetical protein
MGAFNTVTVDQKCNRCGQNTTIKVQFKYGDVWQHQYRIGDVIRWYKNNIGKPGYKHVVADAISEECPNCGNSNQNYEVWLENDRIVKVIPASGKFDFVSEEETYIVLEE